MSTTINNLLRINPRFLRSVNLERDFQDSKALEGYVATQETERHLKRIGTGFRPESGQRAWRITGDFGSGKSSFALVLANLLGKHSKDLPVSIRNLRQHMGLPANAPKLLPILVTGSREPMAKAVLRALHDTMVCSVDGRKKLQSRDAMRERIESEPIDDRTVIRLLENACRECVEKGLFGGFVLIIDELGKFLEYSALHPETQDAYFLQSLAETSSRSGQYPLYTLGLLHQGFAEYADRLPSTVQKEWAKIAERFEEISFAQPLGQVTTLLGAALSANTDHQSLRGWKSMASGDMRTAIDMGIFGPSVPKTGMSKLAPDLYPIHPTVVPVLAKFFRRFGQNERSLFSFLLSTEPYALQDFSTQTPGVETVYRIANFYDFAAFNFSHQLSSQSFRSHWNHIDAIIRSADNEPTETIAILKTIGMLNVLETPELRPTPDLLALATGFTDHLEVKLKELCRRNILFQRGLNGYALWSYTTVNLEQRIQAAGESVTHPSPIAEVVRDRLDARPVVARRHYVQTGNLRYFEIRFLKSDELDRNPELLSPNYPSDGLVAVILCESATDKKNAEKFALKFSGQKQVVIAVSPPLDALASSSLELERWLWVERHTPELKDDHFAEEEVQRQIATSKQVLENRIQDYVAFRSGGAHDSRKAIDWYSEGQNISSSIAGSSLQSYLSDLCDDLFPKAPRVRNELVNRHAISASAASARQKLFKAMLEEGTAPNLGIPEDKSPPEKSIYYSVLQQSGIHSLQNGEWSIRFPKDGTDSDPLTLKPALDAVVSCLEEVPDRRVPVSEIYDLLRSPPYGVRDGLIPIFLLVVFIIHESEIAVYEDNVFRPEIEEHLMMRFAKRPETFEFQLCKINGVRKELIRELANVMDTDQAEKSHLLSIVRPLYIFVSGLPEYVRNTDKLSSETLAFRKAIESAREPAQLIYEEIPKALGFKAEPPSKPDAEALAKTLAQTIGELRRAFPELQNRMAEEILDAFQYEGSLADWRESIADSAETILVGLGEPEFRSFCLKLIDTGNTEADWLESLGSLLTRCPPSRWKDRDETVFKERIHALAEQFGRVLATCFDHEGALPDTAIRLSVTLRSGSEKNIVTSLTPAQSREAEKITNQLRDLLPKNQHVSLTVLAKVIWDLLGNHQ